MGRVSGEGVNFSPLSPLGMGMRDIADRFSGLRSMPTWRGTWEVDGCSGVVLGLAVVETERQLAARG